MSELSVEEKLAVARRGVDALNRHDESAVESVFAPDAELFPLAATALQGQDAAPYRGHEGIRRYMREFGEVWPEYRYEMAEVREVEGRLVIRLSVAATASRSGVAIEMELTNVLEFAGGRVRTLVAYTSWDEALAAAGGAE